METFISLVLLFTMYSFLGWLCESIYCSIPEKRFINRGFLNGPFCPVYGFGALLNITALLPASGKLPFPWDFAFLFLGGMILTSALEYATGYLLEKLFHATWWDYSKHRFNLHGRICLHNSLLFGLMSVLLIKVIHPPAAAATAALPYPAAPVLAGGLTVYYFADGIITVTNILQLGGKTRQLQLVLDEIREKTAGVKDLSLYTMEQTLDELSSRAQELKSDSLQNFSRMMDILKEKADATRLESAESLKEFIQNLINAEIRARISLLRSRQAYLEKIPHIHRRILNAFPQMSSIRSPESLARLKAAAKAAREKVKKQDK
ncbi:MAG TPA: hypothetical protein DD433_02900 [Ruminococcaceae bacterium]|nr:hypothetical protein [Oscillospiraceae bacterium]